MKLRKAGSCQINPGAIYGSRVFLYLQEERNLLVDLFLEISKKEKKRRMKK